MKKATLGFGLVNAVLLAAVMGAGPDKESC
jgi:hypothetical protein